MVVFSVRSYRGNRLINPKKVRNFMCYCIKDVYIFTLIRPPKKTFFVVHCRPFLLGETGLGVNVGLKEAGTFQGILAQE